MEQYVGLFAMDGNVRSTALNDRVWWGGDVLLFFVFWVGLRMLRLDRLLTDVSAVLLVRFYTYENTHSLLSQIRVRHR